MVLAKMMMRSSVSSETYCATKGSVSSSQGLGRLTVEMVATVARMARSRRGGVEPELCMAAGLSPLSTWTITDADSVEIKFVYIDVIFIQCNITILS